MASDDAQLTSDIRAAVAGDQTVWVRLFETYRPAMQRWALSFSHDSEMSQDDLVQEAWLRVCKGLSGFRGVDQKDGIPAAFYSWLRVTARNAMLAQWRTRNTNRRIPDELMVSGESLFVADPNTRTPSSIAAQHEELARLQNAIADMPDARDRQIIGMVFEDGLSLRTVAQLLDMDYSALRRRFHVLLSELSTSVTPGP